MWPEPKKIKVRKIPPTQGFEGAKPFLFRVPTAKLGSDSQSLKIAKLPSKKSGVKGAPLNGHSPSRE
jgi:hypothetical protein